MIMQAFIKHEILNLLKSKRVYLTVMLFILLFASVFIVRVIDFQKQINQYIQDVRIAETSLQNAGNYSFINPRAVRQPIIFSIYNQGFKYNRIINIEYFSPIIRANSLNEEKNLIYLENDKLDITFLITFFLSLFILLISYDSVNGEKKSGTLRILMTWPIKRQSFILKKILGVFIFVAITFSIPYLLSIISLTLVFANLLNFSFFLSAFYYWFLVLLFIFFFSLLGIFISVCTTNPSKSLVYSLLIWISLSIILPVSWEFIFSPKLFDNQINELRRISADKLDNSKRVFHQLVPDEANINKVGHIFWNGGFVYSTFVWGEPNTYKTHYRFQRYLYDEYYPAVLEAEQSNDSILRKRINIVNLKSWVFFFNPVVLFENLSMKIAGNSREDYLKFIHDGREIRDRLIQTGVREGWLFDYEFFARYKREYNPMASDEWIQQNPGSDWGDYYYNYLKPLMDRAEIYELQLPDIKKYDQPEHSFTEIFSRIFFYLILFLANILALWLFTWNRFLKYDIR